MLIQRASRELKIIWSKSTRVYSEKFLCLREYIEIWDWTRGRGKIATRRWHCLSPGLHCYFQCRLSNLFIISTCNEIRKEEGKALWLGLGREDILSAMNPTSQANSDLDPVLSNPFPPAGGWEGPGRDISTSLLNGKMDAWHIFSKHIFLQKHYFNQWLDHIVLYSRYTRIQQIIRSKPSLLFFL